MRYAAATIAILFASFTPIAIQERAPKKPTLAENLAAAQKAADAERFAVAIAALQQALVEMQVRQRTAILAALPKPEGWEIEDQKVDEQSDMMTTSVLGGAAAVNRTYRKGEKQMHVEVLANFPLIETITMLFDNPALLGASGSELVKYGQHRALLKKEDEQTELTLVMHKAHLIKVTGTGVAADAMVAVFDQACVDRLEKPLGK